MTSKNTGLIDFASGCVGGVAQCIVGHPLDLIKVRLQTSNEYKGMSDAFMKIVKQEGAKSLYKGVQSPLTGLTIFNSVMFFTFGQTKKLFIKEGETEDDIGTFKTALAGGITGLIISAVEG
jgi:solute carrier family 25 (mitochondrial carnitine/acylcarnitine transporter), member 20/29